MSWSLSSAIVDLNYITLASSGTGQYLAACGGQSGMIMTSCALYQSSDYGASWSVNTNLPDSLYGVVTSSTSGQNMTICDSSEGIYTSSDFGATWSLSPGTLNVANSCTSTYYTPSLVASASGQYVYSLTLYSGLFYSSDFGHTWAASTGGSTSGFYQGIASSPSGQYVVATTSSYGVYLSKNYGVSYTKTLAPNSIWDSLVCSDSGAITISTTFGMYKSTDLGQTWYPYGDITGGVLMYISADASSTTKMLALSGSQVMQSSNAGSSWYTPSFFQSSTVDGSSTAVNSDGTMMAVGTNGNGIYIGKISYSSGGGSSGGLSGGAIAGVVIGVLAGLAILGAVAWFVLMPMFKPKAPLASAGSTNNV